MRLSYFLDLLALCGRHQDFKPRSFTDHRFVNFQTSLPGVLDDHTFEFPYKLSQATPQISSCQSREQKRQPMGTYQHWSLTCRVAMGCPVADRFP